RLRMNTIARLAHVAWAAFWAADFTTRLWPRPIHSRSSELDINPFFLFLIALSWCWLACAACLFTIRAWAWWACLVYCTCALFITLYITFMGLTAGSSWHWGTLGVVTPFVMVSVFGLHLRTRAQYLQRRIDNAA